MKTLYLLRHAKSSWDDASLSDLERPLNDRGRRTASFMGNVMRERALGLELIVCSPASRARETATAVRKAGGFDAGIVFEPHIYEASPNDLRSIIAALNDKFSRVMLVGHNPGMEGIIYYLTGRVTSMPTAALALVELDVRTWNDATADCGRLIDVLRPKELVRSDI
jgi:phosphohistidine phosphatase